MIEEELRLAKEERSEIRAGFAFILSEQRAESERQRQRHDQQIEELKKTFYSITDNPQLGSPNLKGSSTLRG